DQHYVRASRVATLLTMAIAGGLTLVLDSVAGAWRILLAFGSGTGLVLILRWYWWRINAWSEIGAARSRSCETRWSQSLAISVPSTRPYGWMEWMRRLFAACPEALNHARYVPPRFAASASAWHLASAPVTPPRFPL